MLQATEYDINAYLKWFWRVSDYNSVVYRKDLVKTQAAKLLLYSLRIGISIQYLISIFLIALGIKNDNPGLSLIAVAILVIAPILWAHLIVLPLLFGRWLIIKPYYARQVKKSEKIFARHPGVKIAIAGSFGKTTMKEILATVLSQSLKVAVTPANQNVPISHAKFARSLKGDEDVLIIEYGEGVPGDVGRFVRTTHPTMGVITGLAPAHLDRYKTLEAAGEDIFSLAKYLKSKDVYVNSESDAVGGFMNKSYQTYSRHDAIGWRISNIKTNLIGLSFEMQKGKEVFSLKSQLVGKHQVGPLAFAAALAKKMGLSDAEIKAGVQKVVPFEHRMSVTHHLGASIIDDTYNGNIEGMKAGLALLAGLKAKRKVYVTPGLVDQGANSHKIHFDLGVAIARADPSLVVLIQHSVTQDIIDGLQARKYKGELRIENDPLDFYTNLKHFVADGDVVLMQNDWPDNYN